jgi:hypothetical protein
MTIDYTQPTPPRTPPPPIPGQPAQPQKSGCWKWGLIGCGLVTLIIVIIVVAAITFAFSVIKSTYVYKDAVRRAESNPEVRAALGTPIESGLLVSGNVHSSNDTGTAELNIPISGPKDKGTLRLTATMRDKKWRYDRLEVKPDHGPSIDLLAAEPLGGQNP